MSQARVAAGVPTGGRFAPDAKARPTVTLDEGPTPIRVPASVSAAALLAVPVHWTASANISQTKVAFAEAATLLGEDHPCYSEVSRIAVGTDPRDGPARTQARVASENLAYQLSGEVITEPDGVYSPATVALASAYRVAPSHWSRAAGKSAVKAAFDEAADGLEGHAGSGIADLRVRLRRAATGGFDSRAGSFHFQAGATSDLIADALARSVHAERGVAE